MIRLNFRLSAPLAVLLLSVTPCSLQAQSTTLSAVTLTVTSSANPAVYAAPLTFTVTVTAPTVGGPVPTGTVSAILLGPYELGSTTLDGAGRGVIAVPSPPGLFANPPWGLGAGANIVTFSYSGDAKYQSVQSKFTQWINKADTATTAAVNGSAQPLQLTATVNIKIASVTTIGFALPGNSSSSPSGTVRFFNGTTLLGTATLMPSGLFASTATLAAATVPASFTAVYTGDDNYNGSTSPASGKTGGGTVSLQVSSSANPSIFAEPVTLTVLVAPATAGGPVPTGSVTASLSSLFSLGSVITLDATGKGSLTIPAASSSAASVPWGLAAGSDSILFTYNGDSNYASTQTTFVQMVDKAATVTSASISAASTSVTATVTISEPSAVPFGFALPGAMAGTGSPTGTVQFLNGSTAISTAALSPDGHLQSAATLTLSQPLSSSADIIAVYNGDANYTGSTSPPATPPTTGMTVNIGMTSSVSPSTFAQPVTFSVTVAPAVHGNVVPTGTVQALVFGSDLVGSATLDGTDSASFTVPPQVPSASASLPWGLATGSDVITVTYSGDSNFAKAQTTFNQLVNRADSSTKVLLAPVAGPANQSTAVATVSIDEASVSKTGFRIPASGNLSTSPTGSVAFYNGASLITTVALTPGPLFQSTAVLQTAVEFTSLRAVYNGDTNYNGSSSPSTGTGTAAATVTLASSTSPTTYGAAFTIAATVAPATAGGLTPTGTVTFFDGSQSLNWIGTLDSSGRGSLPIPTPLATPQFCVLNSCPPAAYVMVLGAGSHSITASYSGDANYAAATSTVPLTQQIAKAPSITAISAYNPVVLLSTGDLVATVADGQPPAGGPYHFMAMGTSGLMDGNPTGSVQFYSGTNLIGTSPLTASISGNVVSNANLNTTNAGPNYSATYAGDANFQGSSTPAPSATSVKLTSSANPSNVGQTVTLTATISSTSAALAPTGTVNFLNGATVLGHATVLGAVATLPVSFNTAGSYSLTANYSGDPNQLPSSSAVYTQVVVVPSGTPEALNLTASSSRAVFGQAVTLFATVTGSGSVPPTGTVTFLDGAAVIGSGTLSLSSAHLIVTLPIGTHQISAKWPGDSNWAPAQSAVLTLTVNRAATMTTLTTTGTAWTASVTVVKPGAGTPTGTVQFIDAFDRTVLATVNLTSGSATATLTSVSGLVRAVYSGDTNFAPSASEFPIMFPPRRR